MLRKNRPSENELTVPTERKKYAVEFEMKMFYEFEVEAVSPEHAREQAHMMFSEMIPVQEDARVTATLLDDGDDDN